MTSEPRKDEAMSEGERPIRDRDEAVRLEKQDRYLGAIERAKALGHPEDGYAYSGCDCDRCRAIRQPLSPGSETDPACPDCERTHPWRDHGPIETDTVSGSETVGSEPRTTAGKGEPLTAEEEAKFRESVALLDVAEAEIGIHAMQWSNHAMNRLLATLDAARSQAATEARRDLLAKVGRDALYRRIHALPSLAHHGKGEQCFPITDAVLSLIDSQTPSPAESTGKWPERTIGRRFDSYQGKDVPAFPAVPRDQFESSPSTEEPTDG